MNIIQTTLPGVLLIEPKVFGDERGFFFESFNHDKLAVLGFAPNFFRVWAGAWLSAWAIAFPALLAVRPFVQRMTNRLTGTSTAPGAQGSVNRS